MNIIRKKVRGVMCGVTTAKNERVKRTFGIVMVVAAVLIFAAGPAVASVGYCTSCGCNKFNKDCFASNGSDWYCRCGHHYDDHCFSNRPVSFAGSTHKNVSPRKGFFDDGMNVVWTIGAIIAVFVMCNEKRAIAPAGFVIFMFVKALLKYLGVF